MMDDAHDPLADAEARDVWRTPLAVLSVAAAVVGATAPFGAVIFGPAGAPDAGRELSIGQCDGGAGTSRICGRKR